MKRFLRKLAPPGRPIEVTPAALQRLQEYSWPGNVRQLLTVLEYAVAMRKSHVLDVGDLRLQREAGPPPDEPPLNMEELEAWNIRRILRREHGVLTHAAGVLGMHRDTLFAKMKKYGIERPEH